jgi:hypothetical protein
MTESELEAELENLIERYDRAILSTLSAKAEYLALADAPLSSPAAISRAQVRWQKLDRQRESIRRQIDALEDCSAA